MSLYQVQNTLKKVKSEHDELPCTKNDLTTGSEHARTDPGHWELRQYKWSQGDIDRGDQEENWSKFRDQTLCCHWNSVKDIQHGVEGKFFLRFIAVSYFCGSDLMRQIQIIVRQRKPNSEVTGYHFFLYWLHDDDTTPVGILILTDSR